MLRKQLLTTKPLVPDPSVSGKDIAAIATVLITSEAPQHPIDRVFDGNREPGASRWIAGQSGEQQVILAFDDPQTIRKCVVEIDEPDVSRTQEMAVSVSTDGGRSYRELLRQEFTFSPPGTTRELEEWTLNASGVTHLQLKIKPDKGGRACRATLTTLALE